MDKSREISCLSKEMFKNNGVTRENLDCTYVLVIDQGYYNLYRTDHQGNWYMKLSDVIYFKS